MEEALFHSTNDNVLLLFFSEDTSYGGITDDKCFIFNFVWYFYESNTNFTTSIQGFTCQYTGNYDKKFQILLRKLYHVRLTSRDAV